MLKKIFFLSFLISIDVFGFQGFGNNDGGNGFDTYTVSNLNDSGPGSLREALSDSNRHIVFDVDGTINLKTPIYLNDLSNITVDGTYNKAQHSNLQISGNGIYVTHTNNVIFQNFRIRNAKKYGLLVSDNSYNIIIDHMSIVNSSQADSEFGKNIDINNSAHDITISYSIIAYDPSPNENKYKGMLITDNAQVPPVTNVAIHHNVFFQNYQRSPEISSPGHFVLVNNIIYDWGSYGTRLRNGSQGDIIGNYYYNEDLPKKQVCALIITDNAKQYYLEDNYGVDISIIPTAHISDTVVGVLPKITTIPATDLITSLPENVGTIPNDILDRNILNNLILTASEY